MKSYSFSVLFASLCFRWNRDSCYIALFLVEHVSRLRGTAIAYEVRIGCSRAKWFARFPEGCPSG